MRTITVKLGLLMLVFCLAFTFITGGAALAADKEPYNIEIYTFKVGTFTYAAGVALAELINKNSDWLKATALESAQATVTTRIVVAEPAMRKKIIGFMIGYEPKIGYPPFKEPYAGIRDIAVIGFVTNGFVTLDPALKTVNDLAGKKVGLGSSPSIARVDMPQAAVLKAGIKDVKFSEHGFVDGVRALSDGLIDALLSATFLLDDKAQKYGPNPALNELMSTKKVTFCSFDQKAYDAARADLPSSEFFENYSYVIPPNGLQGQTEPWVVQGGPITWSCDAEMPDEVVYEITRIMAENAGKFQDFHPLGKIITPENMAKLGNEEKVHPGALKYYQEQGIKIGQF